jgi:alpha-glucosidase
MRRARLSNPPHFHIEERTQAGLRLASDTGAVAHIFVLEEDIARLLVLPQGDVQGMASWAIAPGQADVADTGRERFDVRGFSLPGFALEEEAEATLILTTPRLRLTIKLHGLHCVWEQRNGASWQVMAQDRPTQAYNFGWWDEQVHHYTARRTGERYYGLGERSGNMARNGRRFRLINLDPMGYDAAHSDPLYKSIPYILVAQADGACHGVYYDNSAPSCFDFGAELDNYHGAYRHYAAQGGDLDLYMIAGPDPLAVTQRFTWLTGRPAFMPRWALDYSGSTMSYTDAPDAQVQMQRFLEQLEAHDMGCGSFHLSSGYTSIDDKRYVFHWNSNKFPHPQAFVADYAKAGVRLVANIKPMLLHDHPLFKQAAAAGLLVADDAGEPVEVQFWDALGAALDFTNPATQAWWRAQVETHLLAYGIAATWNDNNEFEIWDSAARAHGFGTQRTAAETRVLQPLLMMRASRAAQIAHSPTKRPYVVTRAGMAGMQRYAQTWSGDNRTSWETLRYNLKMGLGLALSGVSNSGHDVGGFAGAKPDAELFIRWVQAGILMPRFSIHSWNDDGSVNEPWMYPEALPAIRALMALRQLLTPFFYDLMWRYHAAYEPMLRPLWLDHPQDAACWEEGDDHMLGRNLLVALVVEQGARERFVRVPAGGEWVDVWRGTYVRGGETVRLDAALDAPPPLLARAGSGICVNLARGGFKPEPYQRGVWLFPPRGAGAFHWSGYEDDGESAEGNSSMLWEIAGEAMREEIALVISCKGSAVLTDKNLTIILPQGEARAVRFTGAQCHTEWVDERGRRCFTLVLDTED